MLKFQQNRMKPESIRSDLPWQRKKNQCFGQKIHDSWKLNGNIFFKLFLGDLDEKMTSAGNRRKWNKKETETYKKLTFG